MYAPSEDFTLGHGLQHELYNALQPCNSCKGRSGQRILESALLAETKVETEAETDYWSFIELSVRAS